MACNLACNQFVVEKNLKEIDKKRTLMLSEYAEKLDGNVKKRYVEKIPEVGVDPLLIPDHKLVQNVCHQLKQVTCYHIWFCILAIIRTNSLKLSVAYKLTTRWCLVSSVVFKELFSRKNMLLLPESDIHKE